MGCAGDSNWAPARAGTPGLAGAHGRTLNASEARQHGDAAKRWAEVQGVRDVHHLRVQVSD